MQYDIEINNIPTYVCIEISFFSAPAEIVVVSRFSLKSSIVYLRQFNNTNGKKLIKNKM